MGRSGSHSGRYVGRKYIAEILGVTVKTVSRYAREGKLPPAQLTPGGHRRWFESEITDFVQKLNEPSQKNI